MNHKNMLIQDTRQTLLPPHLAAIVLPPNNCIHICGIVEIFHKQI
jgi:hypothetical protein